MFRLVLWSLLALALGGIVAACGAAPRSAASPTGEPTRPKQPATATPAENPPAGAEREFRTDFSRHSVPYAEILSGGPPRDGIPALDAPAFVSIAEADRWLEPKEPVILFGLGDDVRAYPIQILIWHEIVNDVVNDRPVLITFCPLCNTAIAFDRTVDGRVLDFGTTGRLRYSNLIMYDRQTETWWQQATGEAIVGELTGRRLTFLPAFIVAWEDFKSRYPDGKVLSRDTGYHRPYGENPYTGYDEVGQIPFLYVGPDTPDKLPPMARVLTLEVNGEAVAYPYSTLQEARVANDTVGGEPVVVFWQPGVASPLDASAVAAGRDVGTAAAFSRRVDGQTLTFVYRDDAFFDRETHTRWDFFGQAVEGPLAGQRLKPLVAVHHFWFSWAAFRPDTRLYQPGED